MCIKKERQKAIRNRHIVSICGICIALSTSFSSNWQWFIRLLSRTFLSSPFISITLCTCSIPLYMEYVFKWQQHVVCESKKIIDNPIDEYLRNWFSFPHSTSMKVKRTNLFYWFHYMVSRYWEIDADISLPELDFDVRLGM